MRRENPDEGDGIRLTPKEMKDLRAQLKALDSQSLCELLLHCATMQMSRSKATCIHLFSKRNPTVGLLCMLAAVPDLAAMREGAFRNQKFKIKWSNLRDEGEES